MILYAAIKIGSYIYVDYRHHLCIAKMNKEGQKGGIQGFVNESGEFLDRKQALEEAIRCNQIVKKHGSQNILFSEDIWPVIKDAK